MYQPIIHFLYDVQGVQFMFQSIVVVSWAPELVGIHFPD